MFNEHTVYNLNNEYSRAILTNDHVHVRNEWMYNLFHNNFPNRNTLLKQARTVGHPVHM